MTNIVPEILDFAKPSLLVNQELTKRISDSTHFGQLRILFRSRSDYPRSEIGEPGWHLGSDRRWQHRANDKGHILHKLPHEKHHGLVWASRCVTVQKVADSQTCIQSIDGDRIVPWA